MHYLGLCAIARDEDPYLREWINYHSMLGVERFILYDHESVNPIATQLRDLVDAGVVDVIRVSGPEQQIPAYTHCLEAFGPQLQWLGFIDLDEFLLPKDVSDLRLLLSEYEDHGALVAHWVVFGSSGHLTRPQGLQIDCYRNRWELERPVNQHYKTICQPRHATRAITPHRFLYREDRWAVNELRFPVLADLGPHTSERIQLNHYYSRSQEDFEQKVRRGRIDTADPEQRRRSEEFLHQALNMTETDDCMRPLSRRLQRELAEGRLPRRWPGTEEMSLDDAICRINQLFAEGKAQEALVLAARMGASHRDDASYWVLKAIVARLCGNHAQALDYAKRSLPLGESVEALFEALQALIGLGRSLEARRLALNIETMNEHLHKIPGVTERVRQLRDGHGL